MDWRRDRAVSDRPTYSIIVPVYNEEAVLPLLLARLEAILDRLDGAAEVIFVDDGSRDLSSFILEQKARTDPRYKYASLSRNFGQQLAITAGLDLAEGDAVIIMDADLQDPPEVVFALIESWKAGAEVVCAQRAARPGDSRLKIIPAKIFYALMSRLAHVHIPPNVGDFRLVDRKVVEVVRQFPERERFVRGLFSWAGFRHSYVTFERPARAGGETKYSFAKLLGVAMNALVAFSDVPLKLALWFGMAVSAVALLFGAFVIAHWFLAAEQLPGWSSTVFVAAFLGGTNMLMTGIMGLYVGRIYSEVKGRPLYVIDRAVGLGSASARAPSATVLHQAEVIKVVPADGLTRKAS